MKMIYCNEDKLKAIKLLEDFNKDNFKKVSHELYEKLFELDVFITTYNHISLYDIKNNQFVQNQYSCNFTLRCYNFDEILLTLKKEINKNKIIIICDFYFFNDIYHIRYCIVENIILTKIILENKTKHLLNIINNCLLDNKLYNFEDFKEKYYNKEKHIIEYKNLNAKLIKIDQLYDNI